MKSILDINSFRNFLVRFRELGIILSFLVLFFILSLSTDTFFQFSNIILIFRYAGFTGILALGAVLMLSQGDIDLSVGSIYNIVGLLSLVLLERGFSAWQVVLIALIAGLVCGFINMSISIILKIPMLIVTLGTMNIFRGLGLVLYQGRTKASFGLDNFLFGSLGENVGPIPFSVIGFITVSLILFYVYGFTRYGIHLRSIGGNLTVARAMGININKTRMITSILNGLLASISAILTIAYLRTALPSFGSGYELIAIAAAIIGGTALSGGSGSIFGALTGALVISLIVNGIAHLGIATYWTSFVTGMIIITAVAIDYVSRKNRITTT